MDRSTIAREGSIDEKSERKKKKRDEGLTSPVDSHACAAGESGAHSKSVANRSFLVYFSRSSGSSGAGGGRLVLHNALFFLLLLLLLLLLAGFRSSNLIVDLDLLLTATSSSSGLLIDIRVFVVGIVNGNTGIAVAVAAAADVAGGEGGAASRQAARIAVANDATTACCCCCSSSSRAFSLPFPLPPTDFLLVRRRLPASSSLSLSFSRPCS